jgi:hypothetical protein
MRSKPASRNVAAWQNWNNSARRQMQQGREAARQRGSQSDRKTDRHRDGEAEKRHREAERQRGREAERQRGREAERQRGREAERQRGREAERQRRNTPHLFACQEHAALRHHEGRGEEVLRRGDQWLARARRHQVLAHIHEETSLGARLLRLRQVQVHLVAVKVSVVRRTHALRGTHAVRLSCGRACTDRLHAGLRPLTHPLTHPTTDPPTPYPPNHERTPTPAHAARRCSPVHTSLNRNVRQSSTRAR